MAQGNVNPSTHNGSGFGETMRNLFKLNKTKRDPLPVTTVKQSHDKRSKQTPPRPTRSLPPKSTSPETVKMKRATVVIKDDDMNIRSATLPRRAVSQRTPASENRRSSYWGPPPMQRSTTGRYADNHRMSRIMMGLELEDEEKKEIQQEPESMPVSILVNDQSPPRKQRNFTAPIPASKSQRAVSISPTPSVGRSSPNKSAALQRSASVSSTSRARPRGRLPSAMEMQKRSSQFVGYWCPYPSTVVENSLLEKNEENFEQELELHYGLEDDEEIPLTSDQEMMPNKNFSRPIRVNKKEEQMQELIGAHFGSDSNPSASSHGSPISTSKSLPSSLAHQKDSNSSCWAVSRGWRIGLYSTREEAQKQTENFPGPFMQQFDSESEAKLWLESGATDARRIPSVRTLELDEDFNHPSLSRMSLYERADMIENRVKRAYSLRREPPQPSVNI